jgi:hypothetical protein
MGRTWLTFSPFLCFGCSRQCPATTCQAPVIVEADERSRVWTLVHGETPIACWLDRSLGDELDVNAFNLEFRNALSGSHWHD